MRDDVNPGARVLFADRPTADQIAWYDDLANEIRAADPDTDDQALDLPTRPHFKAKLLGNTAFLVPRRGNTMLLASADEMDLTRESKDHGTGSRQAVLRLYGQAFPAFNLTDASWANYLKWLASNPGGARP